MQTGICCSSHCRFIYSLSHLSRSFGTLRLKLLLFSVSLMCSRVWHPCSWIEFIRCVCDEDELQSVENMAIMANGNVVSVKNGKRNKTLPVKAADECKSIKLRRWCIGLVPFFQQLMYLPVCGRCFVCRISNCMAILLVLHFYLLCILASLLFSFFLKCNWKSFSSVYLGHRLLSDRSAMLAR